MTWQLFIFFTIKTKMDCCLKLNTYSIARIHMWWTVQEYDIISLIRGLFHTSDLLISLGVIICMVLCVQLTVCKHDRQQVSDSYLPANLQGYSQYEMHAQYRLCWSGQVSPALFICTANFFRIWAYIYFKYYQKRTIPLYENVR